MDYLALADRNWPVLSKFAAAHTALYRASGGRIGQRLPGAPPMLLLDHVGARTGTERTTPLAYVSDGDDLVLIASKGGHPKHPAWFHNLKANPVTTVQVGPEQRQVRARVANPEERARLWPGIVSRYSNFGTYQDRTDREIPLVILERQR
jgi:deazaflavin-dependent oxidoreductase (nitroreductase family)